MDIIKKSIENHKAVTIIYIGKDNNITKRNIDVLGVNDENIKAFCHLRNQVRYFKKDSILAAEYTH
ncbi:hypothetical protein [Clostridium intestinale]|uniref:WYL domain-containing protein n=1 Tax=Clostridium intestinale TaxID=36845 RepID=A0A7D7A643_9CLOT|nr:hypothetical protein [Clostridium intestinale]QLY81678.1 hypothetical protein HZF06_08875 [Clostridium intestinale]